MKKIRAFTLAETLITLMVIGVVAALTIPSLMQQLGDYTLNKQRDVFSKKFAEGLRQMRIDEKLAEKYNSTADFVAEMQKYFKIVGVCNKDDLSGCFGDNFTYHDNITDLSFTTSNLKTTSDIASVTGHDFGFDADVMGVDFSDGTQMLIMVNPDCTGISGGDTQGNHEQCFKYIADVNGKKSPSAVGKDLISNINMTALDFEIASIGAVGSGTYGCPNNDCWQGAKNYCEGLTEDGGGWHLPTEAQLKQIASIISSGACECNSMGDGMYDCENYNEETDTIDSKCDMTKLNASPLWQSISGGRQDDASLWSSDLYVNNDDESESSENYAGCYFYNSHMFEYYPDCGTEYTTLNVLCVK